VNRIELPWPSALLSPNARVHWGAKSRATKAARADGYCATRAAKIGIPAGDVPIMVQLTFNPPDQRRRDQDGMLSSCKAYLDGIADALGVNDNAFRLAAPIIAEPIKGGKVVITIGGGE
jgi:crossover junction endodeoxyribonuclease RusA